MLRAYLRKVSGDFDSRRDIIALAKESQFYDFVPAEKQIEYAAKFTILGERWRSNHRYFSEKQVLAYLRSIGAERRQKGDLFKNCSSTLLNTAGDIAILGESEWQSFP